ncbi:hypothetical protein [Stenotrophomonas maltophilia]|uniref:Transmembrane protein n=1 Tax=Stenotrophomonas maltophilia TaxID=40324 RepID=A0AAP7GRH9_STEMA|nr:hypothetical protein [Stenotrophomonas maltophilia]KOQ71277.1 hypothetical protein ABW43_01485 [Stenotrophomonas maltophilia]OBU61233.1 hypothetical protein A9K56_11045 [Stenotrophomonas maltophilia]
MASGNHSISTTSLTAITVLAFGVGAIAAGWAVGKVSTRGNAADWVAALSGVAAAIGAWFIGISANRYAREAHIQRLTEQARADRDAIETRIRRFNVVLMKVWRTGNLKLVANDALPTGYEGPMNLLGMLGAVEAVSHMLGTLKWSGEEVLLVNLPSQKMLDAIEGRVLGVHMALKLISLPEVGATYKPEEIELFRRQFGSLVAACLAAHGAAEALSPRLEARIQELEGDLRTVETELQMLRLSPGHA